MALPPQRLVNDDLFIINRITANDVDTFKVNANDIGIFLLEAPRPGGGNLDDKFVNDGEINIYGVLQNVGSAYLNLHSANEFCEGKLNFDEGFHITGQHMDVLITHDYATLSKELTCDDGGIDGSTTCMKLDMEWLSENIVCKGLKSTGDCISIDLCKDISGLTFGGDGCLHINLCPDKGIVYHPNNGCLQLDLNYLTLSLSCDGLRPADGDPNSTCMEIDMEWLTDNIRCGSAGNPSADGGSGLIDGGGCIEVDPCWVNNQLNSGNPQYLISDYDATSIDTSNCKLRVNEAWLLQWAKDNIQNIEIHEDALCLEIDGNKNLFEDEVVINLPEDCMKTWTEGVIDGKVKDISIASGSSTCLQIGGTGNKNVASGEVKLKLDEDCLKTLIDGQIPAPPAAPTVGDGTLQLKAGNNITISRTGGTQFSANQASGDVVEWEITSTGGGGGTTTPPTDACDDTLDFDSTTNCLSVNLDAVATKACDDSLVYDPANNCLSVNFPDSCPAYTKNVSGRAFYARHSGGKMDPAIVLGTKDANANGKAWAGIGSNVNNGSWTIYFNYEGWTDLEDCGGHPAAASKDDIRIIQSIACGDNVLPHFANVGLIKNANALNGEVQCFNYRGTDESTEGNLWGGPPQGGGAYTRFCFRARNNKAGHFPELQTSDVRTTLDIDTMIDDLGTISSGAERGLATGLIRWNLKNSDETLAYPAMYMDSSELAAKYPSLVEWTATEDVFEVVETLDSDGNFEQYDHKIIPENIKAENMEPGQLNETSIICAILIANKRLKTRIDQLEQKTTLAGTLNTLGIIEYANETAAANSGLGQGEVYWDTTLNRMRSVT